jgi:hypothetical protein
VVSRTWAHQLAQELSPPALGQFIARPSFGLLPDFRPVASSACYQRRANGLMLGDIVPEVAAEDLEGVVAFAIERNLLSWEQVAIACVEYAEDREDHLAFALGLRLVALGHALETPQLSRWNIKDPVVGWHLHPAVLPVAASEPLNWKVGFDVDAMSVRILLLARAREI